MKTINTIKWLGVVFLIFITIATAQAVPTPAAKSLSWNHSGNDLAGFYLYWAMESEPMPRVYDNTRRIEITDELKRSVILLSVKPDSKDRMCFKMTAYDLAGNESEFSISACGYFGFEAVSGFGIE